VKVFERIEDLEIAAELSLDPSKGIQTTSRLPSFCIEEHLNEDSAAKNFQNLELIGPCF
jgi:hypothetical protein